MPQTDKNEPNYEVPAAHRPEEFLGDEALVEHYRRKADAMPEGPDKDRALKFLKKRELAAAITAAAEPAEPEPEEPAERVKRLEKELAEAKKAAKTESNE